MASRIQTRLFHSTKSHLYSARLAVKEAAPLLTQSQVTQLSNGLKVASVENGSRLTRLALVAKAGPRYENRDEQGVTHCLRHCAGLGNQKSSIFKVTRATAQTGGDISVTSSREYLQYGTSCWRNQAEELAELLSQMTAYPYFRPWEFETIWPKMKIESALLEFHLVPKMMELLHETAYEDTLGRSLYAPNCNLGHLTQTQVMDYMKRNLTSGRLVLVGVGIKHDSLLRLAEKFKPFPASGDNTKPAKYKGGEIRKLTSDEIAYAAVVSEGPSMTSKDAIAAGVLQMIMNSGPHVKYSENGSGSRLSESLKKTVNNPFSVGGVNFNYSDSGLFGFLVAGQGEDMEKLTKGALTEYKAVAQSGVSEAEVNRGKAKLKSSIAMQLEEGDSLLQNLAEQALQGSNFVSQDNMMHLVDSVTANEVASIAKRLVNGKPTMASIGDLKTTPYLSDLF